MSALASKASTARWARRHGTRGSVLAAAARIGLSARAFVYLVIGWLAVQIALGHSSEQANQQGAVAAVAKHPGGRAVLLILGFGLAAYALWRLSEAAFGTAAEGRKVGPRVQSFVRGIVYGGLSVMTFRFVLGSAGPGQDQQQQTLTARLIKHGSGRLLVAVVGLIVVAVGIAMIVEGARRTFEKQLRMNELTGATRTVVVRLGMIGTIARGLVFAGAGALTVDAAVRHQPAKSAGLDGALRTLADRPYGPVLLGAVAVGLILFGLYGFAAARWART